MKPIKRERICPLCVKSESMGIFYVGSSFRKYIEVLFIECKNCRYHFNFISLSILLEWGWIILIPVVFLSSQYIPDQLYRNVIILTMFVLIVIWGIFFIEFAKRTLIFDNYFKRTIVKKARKMVKKGNTYNRFGEKFTNPKVRRHVELQMNLEIE